MIRISLSEAQNTLATIIHRLTPGEIVTITEDNRAIAQIMTLPVVQPRSPRPRPPITGMPKAGRYAGHLIVPDDFKEPLEEMREYVE